MQADVVEPPKLDDVPDTPSDETEAEDEKPVFLLAAGPYVKETQAAIYQRTGFAVGRGATLEQAIRGGEKSVSANMLVGLTGITMTALRHEVGKTLQFDTEFTDDGAEILFAADDISRAVLDGDASIDRALVERSRLASTKGWQMDIEDPIVSPENGLETVLYRTDTQGKVHKTHNVIGE